MKTFIVTWMHNEGKGAAILNVDSLEEAHEICKKHDFIWGGYEIDELDKSIKIQIL